MDELKRQKELLNNKVNWLDEVIRTYIDGRRDGMGLVLPEVRTPTYTALKRERAMAFEELRRFNAEHAKEIHKSS